MNRVLVIEDDDASALEMTDVLEANGFVVDRAADGAIGYDLARHDRYAVITLDRRLPGVDGLSLLERLRREAVETPIIFVSALIGINERVCGLKAGADDYLIKPFAPLELSARVEALARRPRKMFQTKLEVGDLIFDLNTRTATRRGRHLDLSVTEARLLEYLMRHTGRVVTRSMMFEEVLGFEFDPQTNLMDVHIGRLRRKLDDPGNESLIKTVRKFGFKMVLPEMPS